MSQETLPISEREREILRLVATGATNQQIALGLSISSNTVKVHLRNIFAKIGVVSRTEATVWAIRHGLVEVASATAEVASATAEVASATAEVASATAEVASATADEPVQAGPPHDATTMAAVPVEPAPTTPVEPAADPGQSTAAPEVMAVPMPTPAVGLTRFRIVGGIAGALLLVLTVSLIVSRLSGNPGSSAATPIAPEPSGVSAPTDGRWTVFAPLPVPVDGAALVSYEAEQQLFVFGGRDATGTVQALVQRFDVRSKRWSTAAAMPAALEHAAAATMYGRIYVVGGQTADGTVSRQLSVFDPLTQRWENGPDLPAARSRAAAITWEGQLYLIGGWDGTTYRNEVFVYDVPSARWSSISALRTARADAAAVVSAGRLYLIGGVDAGGALSSTEWLAAGTERSDWQIAADLPLAAAAPVAVDLDNSLRVFDAAGRQLLNYDSTAGQWTIGTLEAEVQPGRSGVLLGDRIFFIGDSTAGGTLSAYQARYTILIPIR